jgi:hypothetical protein
MMGGCIYFYKQMKTPVNCGFKWKTLLVLRTVVGFYLFMNYVLLSQKSHVESFLPHMLSLGATLPLPSLELAKSQCTKYWMPSNGININVALRDCLQKHRYQIKFKMLLIYLRLLVTPLVIFKLFLKFWEAAVIMIVWITTTCAISVFHR